LGTNPLFLNYEYAFVVPHLEKQTCQKQVGYLKYKVFLSLLNYLWHVLIKLG